MQEQNQIQNKLPVEACMMATFITHKQKETDKRNVHTIILPLSDFTIVLDEESKTGSLKVFADAQGQSNFISPHKEYFSIVLSASTDPLRTWAGDWGDLGDGHLIVTTMNVQIKRATSKYFEFTFESHHTDLIIPERNIQ